MPKKQKKLVVSDILRAFIEKEFQSMLRDEKKLKEDRGVNRRQLERKEQSEYINIKRKYSVVEKKTLNPFSTVLKKMDFKEVALKGKAKPDLNNFVYMCSYFLEEENKEAVGEEKRRFIPCPMIDISRWIANFLISKGYKKKNGRPYSDTDIKVKIILFDKKNWDFREHFISIYKRMFEDFCNPRPRERFENMTDKEIFDTIYKWNEEAKSEIEKERKS